MDERRGTSTLHIEEIMHSLVRRHCDSWSKIITSDKKKKKTTSKTIDEVIHMFLVTTTIDA